MFILIVCFFFSIFPLPIFFVHSKKSKIMTEKKSEDLVEKRKKNRKKDHIIHTILEDRFIKSDECRLWRTKIHELKLTDYIYLEQKLAYSLGWKKEKYGICSECKAEEKGNVWVFSEDIEGKAVCAYCFLIKKLPNYDIKRIRGNSQEYIDYLHSLLKLFSLM